MFRAILYALISIFAITFLRMVMGVISRGFSDMMKEDRAGNAPPATGGQRPSAQVPTSGEFKPCQKCGTYIVTSEALPGKSKTGDAVYFCSDKCKSEYQAA